VSRFMFSFALLENFESDWHLIVSAKIKLKARH
jgi:hypothetical protein